MTNIIVIQFIVPIACYIIGVIIGRASMRKEFEYDRGNNR